MVVSVIIFLSSIQIKAFREKANFLRTQIIYIYIIVSKDSTGMCVWNHNLQAMEMFFGYLGISLPIIHTSKNHRYKKQN